MCTGIVTGMVAIHTSFSGAPRGAFQQPVYNKCKVPWLRVLARPLQAVHNGFLSETLGCALSWQSTTPALAYSYRQVCGFFQVPRQNVERLDHQLNVPVHGRCGERKSPKVQPSTRPGLEPGTSWLAVRDLTNCTNLVHTWLGHGSALQCYMYLIYKNKFWYDKVLKV